MGITGQNNNHYKIYYSEKYKNNLENDKLVIIPDHSNKKNIK